VRPWVMKADRGGYTAAQLEGFRPRNLGALAFVKRAASSARRSRCRRSRRSRRSRISSRARFPLRDGLRKMHPSSSEALRTQQEIAAIYGGAESRSSSSSRGKAAMEAPSPPIRVGRGRGRGAPSKPAVAPGRRADRGLTSPAQSCRARRSSGPSSRSSHASAAMLEAAFRRARGGRFRRRAFPRA
jgi:hypothetical protein